MLSTLAPRISRGFTQLAAASQPAAVQLPSLQYPYFVPRNTRGNLPVYTDVRNGGTRYLVMIRNVDGNANVSRFNVVLLSGSNRTF